MAAKGNRDPASLPHYSKLKLKESLTVEELIDILKTLPPYLPIMFEAGRRQFPVNRVERVAYRDSSGPCCRMKPLERSQFCKECGRRIQYHTRSRLPEVCSRCTWVWRRLKLIVGPSEAGEYTLHSFLYRGEVSDDNLIECVTALLGDFTEPAIIGSVPEGKVLTLSDPITDWDRINEIERKIRDGDENQV